MQRIVITASSHLPLAQLCANRRIAAIIQKPLALDFREVSWYRDAGGYINRTWTNAGVLGIATGPVQGTAGNVGDEHTWGLRTTALFQPTEQLTVSAMAYLYLQDQRFNAISSTTYVNTGMLPRDTSMLLLDMTPERALCAPGSEQMQYAKVLLLSRPYFSRIPDQSVIVKDPGRGEPHIGATRDREGSYAMIYLPHGQQVTVDLAKISGKIAVAWWFDPRTGRAMRIDGQFATSGTGTFEPPSSGAQADWILVLDDQSRGFSTPGATNSHGSRTP